MKKSLYILVFLLSSIFIFSCGEKEDPSEIKTIILPAPDNAIKNTYKFEIPKGYLETETERYIQIRTIYPEMTWRTWENRYRFEKKEGRKWGDDLIRIFLKTYWQFPKLEGPKYLTHPAVQELKKKFYPPREKDKEVPLIEDIDEPEKFKKYLEYDKREKYVISHPDKRKSIIKCIGGGWMCEGHIIWENGLHIEYEFNEKHFKKMIDVDRAVMSLINSFNPTRID